MNQQCRARAQRRRRSLALSFAAALAVVGPDYSAHGAFPFTKVIDVNTQAPSETLGFTYDTFGRPAIHNGFLTFRAATLAPGLGTRSVVRASPTNQLTRIIKTEASVNSRWLLSDPSTSLSDVAFKVVPVSGGSQPNEYYTTGATLLPAAIGVGAAQIYDGNVVFTRTGSLATAKNITLIGFNANDSNPATFAGNAVDGNDNVPGGGGAKFIGFGDYLDHNITKNPGVQNRSIAFHGFWSPFGADNGIYRWDQLTDTITAIADKNVAIPSLGGVFNPIGFPRTHVENNSQIGDPAMTTQRTARPSLYGQSIAFSYDDLAAKSGVYIHNNGTVKKIADTNTPHPSLGGTFGRFHEVSTIGGTTAFVATGDSGASLGGEVGMSGLYLNLCGMIVEVLREGDLLDGLDVTNIQLSHRGLGVQNGSAKRPALELAFRVNFADSNLTEAIYVTQTSLLCYSVAVGYGGGSATGTSLVTTPLGSTTFTAPVFDESARLRVEMHASQGAGDDAVFGGDMAADFYGVDSLPGNNPALIDFAMDNGILVPEAMSLKFNQDVIAEGLQLVGFGPNDSALIEVGGAGFLATGAVYPDGHIPLGSLLLAEGAEIRVSWDGANAIGDGFSLNNVGFVAVPEPGSSLLALFVVLLKLPAVGRRFSTRLTLPRRQLV
jgi:hypothetical protein